MLPHCIGVLYVDRHNKSHRSKTMKFTSNCQWPEGTMHCGNDITTDTHHSMEGARGVVNLLYRNGFGGDRKIFPVAAWAQMEDNDGNVIEKDEPRSGTWSSSISASIR